MADSTLTFGPISSSHHIIIQWNAVSSPIVYHYRNIDPTFNSYAVINQPTVNAIATITIDGGTLLHPGTYESDFAAIANIVENVK